MLFITNKIIDLHIYIKIINEQRINLLKQFGK